MTLTPPPKMINMNNAANTSKNETQLSRKKFTGVHQISCIRLKVNIEPHITTYSGREFQVFTLRQTNEFK